MKNKEFSKFILSNKKFRLEDNVLICSEARGGSTWLTEIIKKAVNAEIYWEPLQVDHGVVPQQFKLGWRPYIPEGNNDPTFKELFKSILSGTLQNDWTLSYSSVFSSLMADRLIVKFVRANLLLPWLVQNFEFYHKPIFLVRNPIAVAQSQINTFYKKEPFRIFEIPDVINNERYILHYDFLRSLKTPLEQRVAYWCIHNIDTINHPLNDIAWITIYYEDLLLNPEAELAKLSERLHLDISVSKPQKIRKASKTNFFNKFNNDPTAQLQKWQKQLSSDDLLRLQEVYNYFKFTTYSCSDFLPYKSHFKVIH